MSKKKLRNVPAGPRITVAELVEAATAATQKSICSPQIFDQSEHQARLEFPDVDTEFFHDVLLDKLTRLHTHQWDCTDDSSVTSYTGFVYAGKGIVAECVRSVLMFDGDDPGDNIATVKVHLKACAVGREASEAYEIYASWIKRSAWPVVSAESAPILLTMLASELAKKENRASLRNAIPAIKKTATLLKIAV